MQKLILPLFSLFFISFIIWKVYSIYHENKKITLSFNVLKEKNQPRLEMFFPTKTIGDLKIDDTNHLFKLQGQIQLFDFSELVDFKLILNNEEIDLDINNSTENFDITPFLNDIEQINRLDLTFFTTGLNEGKYAYQFIYDPLTSKSDDYNLLLQQVNRMTTAFYQLKKGAF